MAATALAIAGWPVPDPEVIEHEHTASELAHSHGPDGALIGHGAQHGYPFWIDDQHSHMAPNCTLKGTNHGKTGGLWSRQYPPDQERACLYLGLFVASIDTPEARAPPSKRQP